jgi:beta-glucanase (GH16 family)
MPPKNTNLWPAFWLLGSNCQTANKFSGDTGFGGCPNLGQGGYTEIDMVECYTGNCQFHIANPNFGIGNGCDANYTWDSNMHTFKTVWTATNIKQYVDGNLVTTCNQSLSRPMFFIMQIQTGGVAGTPNNGALPASMAVDYVKITQP